MPNVLFFIKTSNKCLIEILFRVRAEAEGSNFDFKLNFLILNQIKLRITYVNTVNALPSICTHFPGHKGGPVFPFKHNARTLIKNANCYR